MTSAASDDRIPVVEADSAADAERPPSPWFELGAQIFLFLLAIAILVNSLSLGLMVPLGPGAGFFPFFLSIGLALLTVAWFVQSQRTRAHDRAASAEITAAAENPATAENAAAPAQPEAAQADAEAARTAAEDAVTERKHIVNVIVSLVVLAILMIPLGYQIPMFLFIVYHLWFRARRRWYTVLIIALAGSVGVFHVFNDLLSVALPYSNIEFLNMIGL